MRNRFLYILLTLHLLVAGATPAAAGLTGLAEWRTGAFTAKDSGRTVTDASYLSQQYSLVYDKSARLHGGRAGSYDLLLGYMWTGVDSKLNGDETELRDGKPLYRGNLLLAPGGLPFRLHLFAEDVKRTALRETSLSLLSGAPGIVNDFSDGTSERRGGTLLVGIRNGSYLGAYRDVLSQLPRLLVDYEEITVRDLKSLTPEHHRTRDLAFISLNKLNNWAHYRHFDYQDFLNPGEDHYEKSYMLGTVDHTYTRRWINLTNWLKISADGTYTQAKVLNRPGDGEHRYDLNLFSTYSYATWRASNFSTFSRLRDDARLDKRLEVPLYLSGELSRDTAWRFQLEGRGESAERFAAATTTEDTSAGAYLASKVETFRTTRRILAPTIEAEVKSGDRGEGRAVKGAVEYYTNTAYNPRYSTLIGYSLAWLEGTSRTGGKTAFLEQQARGRAETRLTSRLRLGLGEEVRVGLGSFEPGTVDRIAVSSAATVARALNEETRTDDTVIRSVTTGFAEYNLARLGNRVELSYDHQKSNSGKEGRLSLRHRLDYSARTFSAGMANTLDIGDQADEAGSVGTIREKFSNTINVRYSPGRVWELSLHEMSDWERSQDGDVTTRWQAEEALRYNVIARSGMARTLAGLEQRLRYAREAAANRSATTKIALTLAGEYFPTRVLSLGARLNYELESAGSAERSITSGVLTLAMNYQKMQIALDYAYGLGTETAIEKEQSWNARIRKIF